MFFYQFMHSSKSILGVRENFHSIHPSGVHTFFQKLVTISEIFSKKSWKSSLFKSMLVFQLDNLFFFFSLFFSSFFVYFFFLFVFFVFFLFFFHEVFCYLKMCIFLWVLLWMKTNVDIDQLMQVHLYFFYEAEFRYFWNYFINLLDTNIKFKKKS